MLGVFQFISAEENASRLMSHYARTANESSFEYDADAWQEAIAHASKPLKWEAIVVALLGVVFLFGGWLVFRVPLTSTIGGLMLFTTVLILSALNNPASLLSGILLKIIAAACLIYSIKEAVHFHQAKQRFQAAQRHHDMGEGHSTF